MRKITLKLLLLIVLLGSGFSCKQQEMVLKETQNNQKGELLSGVWELDYVANSPHSFKEMFPDKIPTMQINALDGQLRGNSGCNNFTGNCKIQGNQISFPENIAMTKMYCHEVKGENHFMETLHKVTAYSISDNGNTLNLMMGDIAIMRLKRK